MGNSRKGSVFERDLCRLLSTWWTGGRSDDAFWRTSSSGGRATIRARKGKRSAGQYGDIAATDERAVPLFAWLVIEAKRGYSHIDILGMLDSRKANHEIGKFLDQAEAEAEQAGVPYYWLVLKRDRMSPIVFVPWPLFFMVLTANDVQGPTCPVIRFSRGQGQGTVVAAKLEDWLAFASPAIFSTAPR